jgi:hypothetical protein
MKHVILSILMLFSANAYSQAIESQGTGRKDFIRGWNFLTKTNYVKNVTDSTSFISVGRDLGSARELSITLISSDSCKVHLLFVGRNKSMTDSLGPRTTVAATDSLNTDLNGGARVTIVLKGESINRLPDAQEFKIITVFRNDSSEGTTVGRTLKYFLRAVW